MKNASGYGLRTVRDQVTLEIAAERFERQVAEEKARFYKQHRPWWRRLLDLRVRIVDTGEV